MLLFGEKEKKPHSHALIGGVSRIDENATPATLSIYYF